MDPWSHFPSNGDSVKLSSKKSPKQEHQLIRSSASGSLSLHVLPSLPPASRAVGAPISKRNESLLRGSRGMGPLSETQEMSCLSDPPEARESNDAPIPCRNLTEAFEELVRVEPEATDVEARTPAAKQLDMNSEGDATKDMSEISPTGIADLPVGAPRSTASTAGSSESPAQTEPDSKPPITTSTAEDIDEGALPTFFLHDELKRELSQALVNRVSFYCVIRDINQEAVSMASNDTSAFAKSDTPEEDEERSPLVVAVNGEPSKPKAESLAEGSMVNSALIDEEKWLLAAIESRVNEEQPVQDCPPTFSEAMGEREYENPLSSLASSRTQLWKPSRSWWEAKSGKNPWIEPKSHNKRWRYLWPLIHYHKFLAKCIKKLKRNGVDVKSSVSPVAVFLREEVCAVSDHLASVSLFTSEEWMAVLVHFNGWTDSDPKAEARLRKLVSKQKLRPLADQCDVDSPLLRSQIDEQFLKAMASAREQMVNGANMQERKSSKKDGSTKDSKTGLQRSLHNTADGKHNRKGVGSVSSQATPPLPQYINAKTPVDGKSRRKGGGPGQRQPPGYPNQNWNGSGWLQPPQYAYGDDTSAQSYSTMSVDGYPQHFTGQGEYGMYQTPGYYQPPQPYPSASPGPNAPDCYYYPQSAGYHPDTASYPMADPYHAEHSGSAYAGHPPVANPNMAYGGMPVQQHPEGTPLYCPPPGYPAATPIANGVPPSPYHYSPVHQAIDPQYSMQKADISGDQTPYKYPPHAGPHVPPSPYWAHIDPLAMAGLFTPTQPGKPSPATPQRPPLSGSKPGENDAGKEEDFTPPSVNVEFAKNAKPLLINHPGQYYHYGQQGAREGYAPPSPATQFMMSPQSNTQAAAYFARNYGHNSPQRRSARSMRKMLTPVYSNVSDSNEKESSADGKDASTVGTSTTVHVTPPPAVRKVTKKGGDRGSPATVQTATESESINDAA